MRRALLLFVAVAAVLVPGAPAHAADIDPYRGLGAWVDVFDYAPRLQPNGNPPSVTADSVDDMAALGVRTLYLQVANPDGASPDQLTDEAQQRDPRRHAHRAGLRVVAWYLPGLADVALDTRMLKTIVAFRSGTARFDAIALDLEYTTRASRTSRRETTTRSTWRGTPASSSAASVPSARSCIPAVQTDVLNPILWPNFPYKRLAESVDVWMPMTYFTFRSGSPVTATRFATPKESVDRLRSTSTTTTPVHVIGGIADLTTAKDYEAFLRAARDTKAIGYSVYDYGTTSSAAWTYFELRGTQHQLTAQSNFTAE